MGHVSQFVSYYCGCDYHEMINVFSHWFYLFYYIYFIAQAKCLYLLSWVFIINTTTTFWFYWWYEIVHFLWRLTIFLRYASWPLRVVIFFWTMIRRRGNRNLMLLAKHIWTKKITYAKNLQKFIFITSRHIRLYIFWNYIEYAIEM